MRRRTLAAALPLVLGAALAACGPTPADIAVSSPDDALRTGSRLVFSTVDEEARPARSVTVRNPGGADLQVTGLVVTDAFALAPGQPTSFTVAPGGSAPVEVVYTPPTTTTTLLISTGSLTIQSNDAETPDVVVTLKGLDAPAYEEAGEPTLRQVSNALGYTGADVINAPRSQRWPIDQTTEVISPYWRQVDTGAPVELVPLARYAARTTGTTGTAGWYTKGADPNVAANRKALYAFAGCNCPDPTVGSGGENQRLRPNTTTGVTTFSPSGVFGLFADQGRSFSDDGFHRFVDNETTPGAPVTVESQTHNFRFYPARTGGVAIPNAWIVGVDIGTDPRAGFKKNYDYQDYVFLLVNAAPELSPGPRPTLSGGEFTGAVGGTVADEDGEGTGFTSVQANKAGNQYDASLVDLDPTAGVLRIDSTNGTASGGADTQKNALQRVFDASYRRWSVGTRVVESAAVMTTQLQHQAVFFGPDAGNFVKLEVEYRDGAPRLVSYAEKNGVFAFADTTGPAIPAGSSVELYLLGDPDLRTIQPAYRIDGGALTNFGLPYAPSDSMRWFSVQAQGGVLASSQLGQGVTSSPSFTATFDWYRVAAR